MVILQVLLLIQEVQLAVIGKRMCIGTGEGQGHIVLHSCLTHNMNGFWNSLTQNLRDTILDLINYRTVRLGFPKLLGKLAEKYASTY